MSNKYRTFILDIRLSIVKITKLIKDRHCLNHDSDLITEMKVAKELNQIVGDIL